MTGKSIAPAPAPAPAPATATATATVNVMKTATVPEAYRFFAVSSHVAFDTLPAGPAGHLNESSNHPFPTTAKELDSTVMFVHYTE